MSKHKDKNILMAGPWCGEFGWEIIKWQPVVRYWATKMGFDKVYVGIQKGHEILYQDYEPNFIYFEQLPDADGWGDRHHNSPNFKEKLIAKIQREGHVTILQPKLEHMKAPKDKKIHKMFGKKTKGLKYDILVNARWTNKCGHHWRDWPLARWGELMDYFKNKYKMASIGIPSQSKWIHHTDNLLGKPLSELVNIMASSRLIIGPSSGPMHLASVCGCHQLIWTDNKNWGGAGGNNRHRYEVSWNPFRTPVTVLDDCNWKPQVSNVIREIDKILG